MSASQSGGCSLGDGLYVQHDDGRAIAFASSGNLADATLIAAAPDLLKALAAARSELLNYTATDTGERNNAVDEAIGKAQGR